MRASNPRCEQKIMKKINLQMPWRLAQAALLCTFAGPALAASDAAEVIDINNTASVPLSDGWRFTEQDGASLYRASCQGCHMAKGEGAAGAGRFPALADNPRLASAAYPVYNVLHGLHGMPNFGKYMSDEQVAAVVNYTRTHLGNQYLDAVTAEDVKKLR
jgi:mono/diheme cytochrome c family protein